MQDNEPIWYTVIVEPDATGAEWDRSTTTILLPEAY